MPGEFDFISWLRTHGVATPAVKLGIGDDLAILKFPPDDLLLVGVDQMMDGVHFDSAIHTPRQIGRKAMNRNLSDCAAMACLPFAAVATLCLPRGVGEQYPRDLFLGMTDAGRPFDCPVVGGDTGSWPGKLVISVTILGRSAGIEPVTRSGAKPGDTIYVTGPLGGSILGRHMTFEPRVELARRLVARHRVHAMIDLSDGVVGDLRHVCNLSGVGATIEVRNVPVHGDVAGLANPKPPLVHSLTDGEDYELLIVSPDDLPPPCVRIGFIESAAGLRLENGDADLSFDPSDFGGWEHTF